MLRKNPITTNPDSSRLDYVKLLWVCSLFALIVLPAITRAATIPDSDITFWVKDALSRDVRVDAYDVDVNTNDGIVTLSGTVDSLAAKKYAVRETQKVDGVLGVINEIVVSPRWRSDADIWNAIHRRILNSATIKSEGISVTCVDGKVTLSGQVASYSEEKEAELVASEVQGVKDVQSKITIEWPVARKDQAIQDDIAAALKRDVYLTTLPIVVMVDNGEATLTGNVATAYEKERAYEDARWIENVKDVKNELKVEPWTNDGARQTAPAPSSAELKETVREALDQDSRLNATDINIQVALGGVTLSGVVYSDIEKNIAEQDTREVVGVGWVANQLSTQVDEREDGAIADDLTFNLNTDSTTEGYDIHVDVNKGIVTLSGSVHTWYEKYHAREIASKVRGVKGVIDHINIDRDTTRTHNTTAVVADIKAHLKQNWIVRQVSDRINVTVENGTATLTGEVDTWAQRHQAEEVAFNTEGVWKVDNQLKVVGYDYDWENWYEGGD